MDIKYGLISKHYFKERNSITKLQKNNNKKTLKSHEIKNINRNKHTFLNKFIVAANFEEFWVVSFQTEYKTL